MSALTKPAWRAQVKTMYHHRDFLFAALVVLSAVLISPNFVQGEEAGALRDRQVLMNALIEADVLHKDRQLIHMSHVCSLHVDGKLLPVVDVMELVPGAATPRGINRIIVLTDKLRPVQMIDYTTQRPLFCKDQRLFVHGDLMIGNVLPEGSVLSFLDNGRSVKVQQVDANELPVPPTGAGNLILQ